MSYRSFNRAPIHGIWDELMYTMPIKPRGLFLVRTFDKLHFKCERAKYPMKIEASLQCTYYNEQEYVNCIWGARLGRDERSIVKSGINLAKKRFQSYSNYSKQRFWLTCGSLDAPISPENASALYQLILVLQNTKHSLQGLLC